ncbi:MAG: DoxX family protein [Planctomycetota bacterium]
MKHLPTVAGALLGLLFVAFGLMVLLGVGPQPEPPPEGSAAAHFFAAFGPTGYLTFVKVCEVVGGALTAIPRTRCLGLLLLGPIVANIVAFHVYVAGDGVSEPVVLGVLVLTVFLIVAERRAFLGLVRRPLPGRAA